MIIEENIPESEMIVEQNIPEEERIKIVEYGSNFNEKIKTQGFKRGIKMLKLKL